MQLGVKGARKPFPAPASHEYRRPTESAAPDGGRRAARWSRWPGSAVRSERGGPGFEPKVDILYPFPLPLDVFPGARKVGGKVMVRGQGRPPLPLTRTVEV